MGLSKKIRPRSPRNSRSGLTPPPTVCNILSSETQIKSLLFNNSIASLDTAFILVCETIVPLRVTSLKSNELRR